MLVGPTGTLEFHFSLTVRPDRHGRDPGYGCESGVEEVGVGPRVMDRGPGVFGVVSSAGTPGVFSRVGTTPGAVVTGPEVVVEGPRSMT